MLMSRRWCCGVSVTLTSRSVLSRWFELNYLKINAAKTQAVAIGPSLYEYEFHPFGDYASSFRSM